MRVCRARAPDHVTRIFCRERRSSDAFNEYMGCNGLKYLLNMISFILNMLQ